MTTIAFKAGVLAADTMTTCGGSVDAFVTKIAKRGSVLAAACGTSTMCKRFLDWFSAGAAGDPPPAKDPNDAELSYWGLLFPADDQVVIWNSAGWLPGRAEFYTAGSGGDYAKGALAMGATPEEAVRVAARFDTKTGGDITVLRR